MKQQEENKFKRDLQNFTKALKALEDSLLQPYTEYMRDSVVKRFEFTLEAAWKALRSYMIYKDRIREDSPLKVIREAFGLGYISEIGTWDVALELRNETSHAYGETYADKAHQFIKDNIGIFRDLLEKLV